MCQYFQTSKCYPKRDGILRSLFLVIAPNYILEVRIELTMFTTKGKRF